MNERKNSHGGARPGAGRPKGDSELLSFRCPRELADKLREQDNKTEFIRRSLRRAMEEDGRGTSMRLETVPVMPGSLTPASKVRTMRLPFYDQRVTAGFPVPLDNDEQSQDIDTAEILQRQSISTSRSFGEMISSKDELKASVASFAASCCNTLRAQESSAGCVSVFACSNRFREDLPQYANIASAMLSVPSSDTLEITQTAMGLVDEIYRPGILFKKSGVILSRISRGCSQNVLFDPIERRDERVELSRTIDRMNHRYGLRTVSLAVEGGKEEAWKVRRDHATPNYLTDIDQLMTVNV